jgi:hypothetical protein
MQEEWPADHKRTWLFPLAVSAYDGAVRATFGPRTEAIYSWHEADIWPVAADFRFSHLADITKRSAYVCF